MTFPKINSDLFVMAYATYVAALADASLQDNQQDAPLFAFLQKTLELMEEGLDYQVLTNIFEIQILTRFGISLNFNECVFAIGWVRPLIFLSNMALAYVLIITMRTRNVVIWIQTFPICSINFKLSTLRLLETISLKSEIKQELRQFMDQIYEEYVGIHLKSKKFIDSLADWGQLLKEEDKWKKSQ